MAKKIDELKARFGGTESVGEYDTIIKEIEKYGLRLSNIQIHHKLGADTIKKLKKEGFEIGFENNCYIISGW